MKRMKIVRLFALMAAMSLFVIPARAQSTATLQGTVVDSQSAAIPGATVEIRNTATALTRTLVTDASGSYIAASLPPGDYNIEVSLTGFQTKARTVTLEVGRSTRADVQLSIASVAEQVNVIAEAPLIDTATVSVGTVVNQRTVQEIPLNGRHFVDLGLLIPGSVTPPQNGFLTAPLRGQGSFAFNTAGNREDTVNFMINGVNLNDMAQNQITFQPSINTVQEFKVDNSTFSAAVRPQLRRDRQHRDALGQQQLSRARRSSSTATSVSTRATRSTSRRRASRRSSATSSAPRSADRS